MHRSTISAVVFFLISIAALGQDWELRKEKEGIKVFTSERAGSNLKQYKVEALYAAPMEQVFEAFTNTRLMVELGRVKEAEVLFKDADSIVYYFVIDFPWPFLDRDVVVQTLISRNDSTIETVSKNMVGVREAYEGRERLTMFSEKYLFEKRGPDSCKLYVEGFAELGGNIPSWLVNSLIVDDTYNSFFDMKEVFAEE